MMIRFSDRIPKTFHAAGLNNGFGAIGSISTLSIVELWKRSPESHHSRRRWQSTSAPTENRPSYFSHVGSTPLAEQTIGQLLDQAAERFPNNNCLVSLHQNVRLTFSEARKRADKFAAGLKKLGLKKGDRIGVWGPNTVEWYIAFLALARAGFNLVGINSADQSNELQYGIQKVDIRAVIAPNTFKTQNYTEMLLNARSRCPTLEHIIIADDNHFAGTRRFVDVESLASKIEVEVIGAEQGEISPGSGAIIQFTSGTTGRPKAAEVSHMSFVNNSRQGATRLELDKGEKRICQNVPSFHAFGLVMATMAPLHCGATMVLSGFSFNPKEAIDAILKEKCNVIYGTPTMWVDMVNLQQKIKAPIGKILNGVTGGAPASQELFKKIKSTFRFENMGSIYGLSETTAISFQTLPETSGELMETTVGHLSDHIEAQVVDENGVPVPFGSPGELWIRGYNTMIGYWGDEENTKKTITDDGWLKSGDCFILRDDGYGKVIGRLKEMIIRGGENIYPREIEDFLGTHPAVTEAHVFGVHDDRLGEEVCACIRLREGVELSTNDVKEYGKGRIAHFKIPRYVHFADQFPKTASGKVLKHRLRKSLEDRGLVPARPTSDQTH